MKVDEMKDEQLLASTKEYAAREREATTALEAALAEVDARWPGMRQGWPQRVDDGGGVRREPRAPRRSGRRRG